MRKVNIDALKQIAANTSDNIYKIYLHWSAGRYDTCFDDYHINITGDGDIYASVDDFAVHLNHTYMRNSNTIGIALCCAYNATTDDLGDYAPTTKQIEVMAQVVACLSAALDIPISLNTVMTHGEAADNEDGYYPPYAPNGYDHGMYGPRHSVERWDLEYLGTAESPSYNPYATDGSRGGDVLRGKAIWYKNNRV